MKKISVIIPAYNASKSIERVLASVQAQDGNFQKEIIVVDDCSTDNTVDLLQKYEIPNLRIFVRESNQGPASARNLGLLEATGDYIALLDADDYWLPGFLDKTFKSLETYPECVCAFVGQEHRTISCQHCIIPPCFCEQPNDNGARSAFIIEDFFQFWEKIGNPPFCSGSVLMRSKVIKEIGGQRSDLRLCEDLEYWCLLALHGKMVFVPEILFVSDGVRNHSGQIISRRERLRRFKPRWQNARPVSQWAERLQKCNSSLKDTVGYRFVTGYIASIMVYYMLQDGRWRLSYSEFKLYRDYIPQTSMWKLMNLCSSCKILWYFLCIVLYIRERVR